MLQMISKTDNCMHILWDIQYNRKNSWWFIFAVGIVKCNFGLINVYILVSFCELLNSLLRIVEFAV